MWGSFVYLFLLLVSVFALLGLGLIYFMITSFFSYDITFDATIESAPNIIFAVVMALLFIYLLGALNAGLAKSYSDAMDGVKTSLLDFYYHGISRAPVMFGIVLMREFISILIIGPAVAIYYYFLMGSQYMDIALYSYAVFFVFIIHMVFTPALISGALGSLPFESFRTSFLTVKTKILQLLGLYIIFAFVWLLNFVPLLQLFSIFIIYPIAYSALIVLVTEKGGTVTVPPKARR